MSFKDLALKCPANSDGRCLCMVRDGFHPLRCEEINCPHYYWKKLKIKED